MTRIRTAAVGVLLGALTIISIQQLNAAEITRESFGLVDSSTGIWHLYDGTRQITQFFFGNPGDYPFMGDWDCDGVDTPGLYRQSDGYVYLRDSNTQGVADIRFFFGNSGDVPLAGDFDGDGCDTVSLFRPSQHRIYVVNELGSDDEGIGAADYSFTFGNPGDTPFVGDFDADGMDTIGLHRASTGYVYLRNSNATGVADNQFFFGNPGDLFVAADWLGNGIDSPGLFRPSTATMYARYENSQGNADESWRVGQSHWIPVTGYFGEITSPASSQPGAPIRAAFMYPWFPKAWSQAGIEPFTWYSPLLGLYDSSDPDLIDQQVELASDAGLEAFIASWWGPGHHTDSAVRAILERIPQSSDPDFRLAVYYEEEGQSNPSSGEIADDLAYMQKLFDSPAYLRVDGKPVVFVWSSGDSGPDVAKRWADAKAEFGGGVYIVLKVFSGFRDVADQPDSWHQYGPSTPYHEHLPYSAAVSPGFWLRTDSAPALVRDPSRFRSDAERVASSGAFWQLVTTWNEWGEGTAVEPADEFGTTYLDILAEAFGAQTTPPTTLPPPDGSVTFTASGDIGASSTSAGTLNLVADLAPDAHFVVGDLSYSHVTPESAWCDFVKDIIGPSMPFELLTGNHEDDNGSDGFVRDFTACLPDRLGSEGDYGVQYYADLGGVVRVIAIAADLEVDGVKYRYRPGSPERAWLESAVSSARAGGMWVVVMHHKVCISSAEKACSVGEELADWEAENVDLVVMGHTHTYQRSHQLSCVDVEMVTQACISDSDGNHKQGDGAVFVINGLGGSDRPVNRTDDEFGYFAVLLGEGDPLEGHGVVRFTASATQLTGTFIGSDTTFTDTFSIRR